MALRWVFSGVVKAPERPGKRHPCRIAVSIHPTATRRRRLDTDPAVDQADQRTGKGSLQPRLPRCGIFRNQSSAAMPSNAAQQGFNLAKFCRPLVTEPLDRAQQ